MVRVSEEESFVVADIPGLIEGAHLGHGLGTRFLRHIERTRLLAHVMDVSERGGPDPEHDFEVLMEELASFETPLAGKPMVVVASKTDAAGDGERLRAVEELAARRKLRFFATSAATGAGIQELIWGLAEILREIGRPEPEIEDTDLPLVAFKPGQAPGREGERE